MKVRYWRRPSCLATHSNVPLAEQLRPKNNKTPTKSTLYKQIIIAIACTALLLPIAKPTHAGVFDPLLKILLPFYKKDDQHTEPVELIDDGQDDDYQPANHDLPSALLDDSLLADDISTTLDSPDLYTLLAAEFAADRGNINEALTAYKAESFKDNATAIFERALSLSIEYEHPSDSLAFATAWQSKNPDHIPAWFYVTHLALKAHDYDQAAKMIAMILQYDSQADLSQIFRSIFPTNHADQQELYHALRDIDGDNPSVTVLRSGLLMQLGDYDASLVHVNQALQKEPNNLAFINLKLNILNTAGYTNELWQFLHAKRRLMPKETSLYLYEIRHLIGQGKLKDAWELLLIAHTNTQNPDVILLAGLVGLDIGEYTKSIELLTPLTKNPDFNSQAHYYIGIGYERLGDALHARHHYERVKNDDNVLDARTKVVGFYLMENNVEAAMSTLVRLRDEYEIYAADSYILQAEIYLRQGDAESAQDLLSTANRQYPDDDRLLFASYQLLENELSDDEKQTTIDKLLGLDPHNPSYQLSYAKLVLSQNPDDQAALDITKTISRITVDDPLYDKDLQLSALILLGNHALAHGNYQAIIDHLQAAYEVSLDLDAGILLLRAYQGLGNDDMVQKLLAELQAKYGFGNQPSDTPIPDDTQVY